VRRLTRFAIPGGVPAQAGLTLDAAHDQPQVSFSLEIEIHA